MTNEEMRLAIAKAKGLDLWKRPYRFRQYRFAHDTEIKELVYGDSTVWQYTPNWPENIADAWELYREMKQAGCVVVVTHDPITGHGYCHVNVLNTGARLKSMIGNYAATEELAICLSWLEWKAKWHAQEISHNDP